MSGSVGCCVTVTVGFRVWVADRLNVGEFDEKVEGILEVTAVGADNGKPDGDTTGCKVEVIVG